MIIPVRDAAATLPRTLAALAAQDERPLEVIVVDDGSADGGAELAERHPVVTAVLRQPGAGPGAARNRGAAAATGDVLAFTDADCFPRPTWLAAGLRALRDADLVQGAVLPERPCGVFDRTVSVTHPHGLFETANMLVRRGTFEGLGGFEPWLAPKDGKELGEDVWLGWRAVRSGARVAFAEDAVVEHAVFERGAREAVAELRRLEWFPVMAARIPELRDVLFYRRVFHSRRSAAFDAAVAGLAVSALARRPAPLLATLPYASLLYREVRRHPLRFAVKLAAARVAGDVVSALALTRGNLRARTILL